MPPLGKQHQVGQPESKSVARASGSWIEGVQADGDGGPGDRIDVAGSRCARVTVTWGRRSG
jgi:hypothetical protein